MTNVLLDGISYDFNPQKITNPGSHPIKISSSSTHAEILLALLIGGIKISDSNLEAEQNKNYMIIGAPKVSFFSNKNLEMAFADLKEEINGKSYFHNARRELISYLKSQRVNHNLFSPLLNEISRSIINNNNGRSLSAFVFSYRAIESASYSFPLFYCRYEREYLKVYRELKEFFTKGELEFCNNFFRHLINSDGLNGVKMQITFSSTHSSEFVSCMTNKVSWLIDKKSQIQAITQISSNSVELNLEDCFDLIVRLRNGFFHQLSGSNSSISSDQIKDADSFFEPINDVAIQILAFIYGKIIRTHL